MQSRFFTLLIILLLSAPILQGQLDTLSNYSTLDSLATILSSAHPQQIARISPERPGVIKHIDLNLDGAAGSATVLLFGQEGGSFFPFLKKKIHPAIPIEKKKEGPEKIGISLTKEVLIEQQQFYIVLKDFSSDFGFQQDTFYTASFCNSPNGGKYYPTFLLKPDSTGWVGSEQAVAMDVVMEYVSEKAPLLEDVTDTVGIPTNLRSPSIAWGDVDGDGWQDVLIGTNLYRNESGTFVDITKQLEPIKANNAKSTCFVDMDNDGDQDILVLGRLSSHLYINDGSACFTISDLALPPFPSLSAYSLADINKDKLPDLFVAQLWGTYPCPLPNFLFLNNGVADFKDITKRLYRKHDGEYNFPKGIICEAAIEETHLPNRNRNRRSRGAQFVDFDLDGDVDLYITNYFLEEDELYENRGKGHFRKRPTPKPLNQSKQVGNHGTGVDCYDYDNDGDFDLLVPQLAHPWLIKSEDHRGTTLFLNHKGKFIDVTQLSGLQYEETHAGAAFGDINNDGLVDMLTTVYYGCRYVAVYLQQADHTFKISTYESGLAGVNANYDACFVDYNKDGQLDVAIGGESESDFRLYRNRGNKTHNWVAFNLKSVSSNQSAIGAIVKVYANSQVYTQQVHAGRGQRMQKTSTLHFGLGIATAIDKVEVFWNKRKPKTYSGFEINQYQVIEEL